MKGRFIRYNSVLVRMRFMVHRYVAAPIFPTNWNFSRISLYEYEYISYFAGRQLCKKSKTIYMGWRKEQQICDRRGWRAQRPVMRVNEPKKTRARGKTGA